MCNVRHIWSDSFEHANLTPNKQLDFKDWIQKVASQLTASDSFDLDMLGDEVDEYLLASHVSPALIRTVGLDNRPSELIGWASINDIWPIISSSKIDVLEPVACCRAETMKSVFRGHPTVARPEREDVHSDF